MLKRKRDDEEERKRDDDEGSGKDGWAPGGFGGRCLCC